MTKPWADQPYKLISTPTATETAGLSPEVIKVAIEMTLAHNMMIRNLNSVYLQCENITSASLADKADFILYCQTSVEEIHEHHTLEEQYFFLQVAEFTGVKDIMDINYEQHRAFESGLKKFEEYIYKATPETYDGKTVKKMVEDFVPILAVHLTGEIQTLLGLEQYDHQKLIKAWDFFNAKILENIKDKHRVLPSALGANDKTFEGGIHNFPEFPFFVPYLVAYYYARKYKGSWRFSPCTMWGEPQELPFVNEV